MPALLREEKDSGTSPRSVPVDRSSCYDYVEDQDEDLPLVFRKPCWQLYATLISTLITPLLYRVYLILVTIGWALFSKGTSGSYTNPCKGLVCLSIVYSLYSCYYIELVYNQYRSYRTSESFIGSCLMS